MADFATSFQPATIYKKGGKKAVSSDNDDNPQSDHDSDNEMDSEDVKIKTRAKIKILKCRHYTKDTVEYQYYFIRGETNNLK